MNRIVSRGLNYAKIIIMLKTLSGTSLLLLLDQLEVVMLLGKGEVRGVI